jgi:hypothetical protein
MDVALRDLVTNEDLRQLIKGQSQYRYMNVSWFGRGTPWGDVIRPIRYRVATEIATSASEALDVAVRPWPDRVRGMASLRRWSSWYAPSPLRDIGSFTPDMLRTVTTNYTNGVAAAHVGRTAIALEVYRRAQHRYPASLEQLGLADDRALDPFTGTALVYRRGDAGYVLYSVGSDGKDDGGSVGPATKAIVPGALGKDLGITLTAPGAISSLPR